MYCSNRRSIAILVNLVERPVWTDFRPAPEPIVGRTVPMQNSIAAGRRLALRVVVAQFAAAAVVAAGFLFDSWRAGLAALCGGSVVAAATSVLALRLFAGGPGSGAAVMGRLIVGNLLKWAVVALGLYLTMVRAGLPGLPAMCGVVAALVPQLFGLHDFWARRD